MEPLYTPRAETDLQEIWQYIGEHNPLNADRFIADLISTANRIADFPRIGRLRSRLRPGVRSFPHAHYLILYEFNGNRVKLLRFIHGSRRLTRIIFNEE